VNLARLQIRTQRRTTNALVLKEVQRARRYGVNKSARTISLMTRSHMGALLALLTIALSTRIAAAQSTPTSAPSPAAAPAASPAAVPPGSPAAAPGAVPAASPAAVPGSSPGANPAASPAAVPGASPAANPAASPAEAKSERRKSQRGPEAFFAGDYLWGPYIRNEYNLLGENGKQTFVGRAAVSLPIHKLNVMAEYNFDQFQFEHLTSPVVPVEGAPAVVVPSFFAHYTDWDARVGVGIPYPGVHLVASYGERRNSFKQPNLQGFGFGIEKLPDFDHKNASFFGSYLWYPQFGSGSSVQYGMYKYSFGIEIHAPRIPVFVEFGVIGDYAYAKKFAPTYLSDSGVISGIGIHF
jgi:hypothetical protein